MWSEFSISFDDLPAILIGVFASILAFFRFISMSNRKSAFIFFAASILISFIFGPVLNATIPDTRPLTTSFFTSYLLTFFFLPFIFYIWHYKKHKSILTTERQRNQITFLDYCIYGITSFKNKIRELDKVPLVIDVQEPSPSNKKIQRRGITPVKAGSPEATLRNQVIKDLISEIRDHVNSTLFHGFAAYIFKSCRENYFKGLIAHFTIHAYDSKTNSMVTIITTRRQPGKIPGSIPLDKPNQISNSFNDNCKPKKMSDHKSYHYHTENDGYPIRYDNYGVMCIVHDTRIPLFSLCLEVKGKKANRMLDNLIESGQKRITNEKQTL
jgi:hypothetical protein